MKCALLHAHEMSRNYMNSQSNCRPPKNSEAHGGEAGVSIGGEPRQGVKGNVREDTRGTERAPDAADPS